MGNSQNLTLEVGKFRYEAGGPSSQHPASSEFSEEALRQILVDPNQYGAVVTGQIGSGRRARVEEVLASFDKAPRVVKLSGNSFGAKMPLGILSFMLAQLDIGGQPTMHELVHGLGKMLLFEQNPSIVVLGSPELIDESSSTVLAQLVVMKKIRLVVLCENIQQLPQDLFVIHATGRMKHLRIKAMDMQATHAYLERLLGGRVSTYCSTILCNLTGGNRRLIQDLTHCWMLGGKLIERSGIWVLNELSIDQGSSLQTLQTTMITNLGTDEKDLLSVLALGGPVPLERLHQVEKTEPLDGLLKRGYAVLEEKDAANVSLSTPLLALLGRTYYANNPGLEVNTVLARIHKDPSATQILESMKLLNLLGNYAEELEVAEAFQSQGFTVYGWELEPQVRAKILDRQVKALLAFSLTEKACEIIKKAQSTLQVALERSSCLGPLEEAFQRIQIMHEFASNVCINGTPEDSSVTILENTTDAPDWITESLHLRALALRSTSWAARASQNDAMLLAESVDEQLQYMELNSHFSGTIETADRIDIELQLLQSELLSGCWSKALTRVQRLKEGKLSDPLRRNYVNLLQGVLFALRDDRELALNTLEPCVEQMRVLATSKLLAVAEPVMAYLTTRVDQYSKTSQKFAAEMSSTDFVSEPVNFYTWVSVVFSALTLAEVGQAESAKIMLRGFASRAKSESFPVLESLTLAFALKLGDVKLVSSLQSASEECQGHIGQRLGDLAGALLSENSASMLETLVDLAQQGHILLASSEGSYLTESFKSQHLRKLSQTLNEVKPSVQPIAQLHGSAAETTSENEPGWVKELTKREAQIASLAILGRSNQEIAKLNGVSIRTVEGHLYQVYSKLQVCNRQELTALDRASRRAKAM